MDVKLAGMAFSLMAAASWAAAITLYKVMIKDASAYGVNLLSHVMCLLLFAVPFAVSFAGAMPSGVFFRLFLSGLLGIAVGETLFFEGLRRLTPYVIMLMTFLGQILVIVLAAVFLGERQTAVVWCGIVVTMAGLMTAVWNTLSKGEARRSTLKGMALGILSISCESVSVILAKKELAHVSAVEGVSVRLVGGIAGLLLFGAFRRGIFKADVLPLLSAESLKGIATAVLLGSFLGYWFFHAGLKRIDVSIANTLNNATPLFAIPLSCLILKEKVGWKAVAGIITAFIGIAVIGL